MEERLAPALITIDTSTLAIYSSDGPGTAHGFDETAYSAQWTDNGQVAEFDFAGSFTVSSDDTVVLAGDHARTVRLVIAGDANFAGNFEVYATTPVDLQVGGAIDVSGNLSLAGQFSASATRFTISGDIQAASVSLTGDELINLATGSTVVAADGGFVGLSGRTVINSGELRADGVNGGRIEISAANVQNSGSITANGTNGAGGEINVAFSEGYLETRSGLVSANGVGGAGGQVVIDGGFGYLFTSGRHEARGTVGGDVRLFAGEITAVAATEDVTGTTGAGGTIIVLAEGDADYTGTLIARGVTSGGFIEVSAHGTLTYGGNADSGASAGPAGTLLLDPKNLIINGTTGSLPQFDLVDPHPNSGGQFGKYSLPLSTGNILVADPADNLGGSDAGAVYLFDGLTGALISSLIGGANDKIGATILTSGSGEASGLFEVGTGNFIVSSPDWNGSRGAVTWGDGQSGINGVVSAANSLVGALPDDRVGITGNIEIAERLSGITVLHNGNYVVSSCYWNDHFGAVTWGDGNSGIAGAISSANSLVGSQRFGFGGDNVGSQGIVELTNGNYVVNSPRWNQTGAVTWGSGTAPLIGEVSATNSLTGTGRNVITPLTNGNYVTANYEWNVRRGAVTWANGAVGLTGNVSVSNSLTGANEFEYVGINGVTALTNGNYVVSSSQWGNGRGAATWGNGATGIVGAVSTSNSLTGTTQNGTSGFGGDGVGLRGATALTNGNYVVMSSSWSGYKGAVTWGNGSTGITGAVSSTNSLVGSNAGGFEDWVGEGGVTALTNGNYVVASPRFNRGKGAATWANGATGLTGAVSTANSLVSNVSPIVFGGGVGGGGVVALPNGNFVVVTPGWSENYGAVTWGDGTRPIVATISSSNSLVGSSRNDVVGNSGVIVLSNGNYVVSSSSLSQGNGAATWGSSTAGVAGVVSTGNSFVGTAQNRVGGVVRLANGNYAVTGSLVTIGSGTAGLRGTVSLSNSFNPAGSPEVLPLADGNLLVTTPDWNNSTGGVTWLSGTAGTAIDGTRVLGVQNSLVGRTQNSGLTSTLASTFHQSFVTGFSTDGSGRVTVGFTDPNLLTFSRATASTVAITPAYLAQTLNTGTSIVLQADNDITVSSSIVIANPSGNGGSLTLVAGRSIRFENGASITTDNGNLTLIANELPANGVIAGSRDSGPANILVPLNSGLNLGTGTLTVILRDTAGANIAGTATLAGAINSGATVASTTTTFEDNGPNPSIGGQPVSFKVTVSPIAGAALSGVTVTIVDANHGNAVVATPTLTNGTATFTISTLDVGSHDLVAVFAGNSTSLGSQSLSFTQVVNPNTVLTPPVSQAVNVGSMATFTTLSALPLIDAVQWQVSINGGQTWQPSSAAGLPTTAANSATSTTLAFTTTAAQNGYQYRAAFTNAVYTSDAALVSTAATLAVNDTITQHPTDQAVMIGQSATFTAASGYPADQVRWQVSTDLGGSWIDIPGATSTTLTLPNIAANLDGSEYRAVFTPPPGTPTDPARTTTINGQTVLVTNPAFLILGGIAEQPVNQSFAQTVSFSASSVRAGDAVRWHISTDGGLTFQPLSDTGPYSGTQTTTLTITGTTLEMLSYAYKAVFSNSQFTLSTVTVGLIPADVQDSDPAPNKVTQDAVAGQSIGLTVTSDLNNGSGLTYQLTANASGRFAIDATTGVVTVANGAAINVVDQAYLIQVQAKDSAGNSALGEFTISVTGAPPTAPVDQNVSPNSVVANSAAGTVVGITAFSADLNPVTYSLSDNAGGRFQINSQTGVVSVLNGSQIAFPNTYSISVLATGAGGTSTSTFTVITNSSDASAITIGGYSLLNPVINGANVAGTVNLPVVGEVSLSGTVSAGQYQLTTTSLGSFSINGFTLSNPVFTLRNSGLTLAGSFTGLPLLGTVQVSGAFSSATDFKLTATSPLPSINGLTVTGASIIPSSSGLGLAATVNLPSIGAVSLSGTIVNSTNYNLTAKLPSINLNGRLLSNVQIGLTANGLSVSGTASLPLIGTVTLSGMLQNGQYSLTANIPQLSVAGITLTGAVVTLSSSGISLTANATLPLVNNVSLTGTIQDSNNYSFTASAPNLSLAGFTVSQVMVNVGATGLTLSGTANLPVVGSVSLTGTLSANGNVSLVANVPSMPPIAGIQLTGVKVTLTKTSLGLSGMANLPLIGNVQMVGLISDANHYSVSFTPGSIDLGGGFSLSDDVRVTLSPAGLNVVGNANLPIIGSISRLQGTIQDATHFSLTAPLPDLSLGQFSLKDATVGLVSNGGAVQLTVAGTVHLPLFNDVKFTGTIDSAGNLSLSTPLPDFSLPGGFIKFTGGVLTLHPDRISVDVDLSISGLADAHFTGTIRPDGTYELEAYANLKIAGFDIPIPSNGPNLKLVNGQLDIGFDYGIPGLSDFIPGGDTGVTFSGSYGLDGSFSLTATAHYKFTIGPVVVNEEFITLTNTSLTLGARGSIADLGPLAQGEVSMTIYKDGTFHAEVTVDSKIGGFSLGNAEVTFGNHNPDRLLISTLHAHMSIPGMTPAEFLIDGYWDANGNYDFKGSADVQLGGLSLAQAQFAVNKIDGVSFSASVDFGVIQATVSGSIASDDAGGFTTTTDVVGTVLRGPKVNLHGSFDTHGNYNFEGEADLTIGPLTLSRASFRLNNQTGLTVRDEWNFGVYTSSLVATFQTEGLGYSLTVDATGTVFGQSLNLHGEIHSTGRFDLSGTAVVGLPLFNRSGTFDLSNRTGSTVFMFTTGLDFGPFAAAQATGTIVGNGLSYDVTIDARGTVFGQSLTLHGDLHSNGKFDLSGTAKVGLEPLLNTTSTFSLSNKTGANVFKFSGNWSLGPFDAAMTGTIVGTSQSFTVGFEAVGKVFGQALTVRGDIRSNGKFELSGSAKVGLAPLLGTTATFVISNMTGPTSFKFTGTWNIGPFSSALTATIIDTRVSVDAVGSIFNQSLRLRGDILGNGQFDLSGSANVGLAPLVGTTATFRLSNLSGTQVFSFTGGWTLGAFSSVSMTGTIVSAGAGSNVTIAAQGTLLGNTIRLGGTIFASGRFDIFATNNLNLFGVSLSSVTVRVSSNQGFEISARWGHSLFNGNLTGSIASDGRVRLTGNSTIGRAGFGLNVGATIDLRPAQSNYFVSLSSNLDVYVANVAFKAEAQWSGNTLPTLTFTGSAGIGGVLSKVLTGQADFTIGTNVVRFEGHLGIPKVPGLSLDVSATVRGDGTLSGLPGLGNIFSLGNLADLAAGLWYDLGASWADAAKGLNQALGISDQDVAKLLRAANASPGELRDALSSAFNWSNSQLSGFLSSGGGLVGSVGGAVGGVLTGKTKISLGVPAGSLVFFDGDKDFTLDAGEAWGYTTPQGEITFEVPVIFDLDSNGTLDDAEGQWIVQGGIDLTTGLAPVMDTIAPASWPVASPLTTLASALYATGVPLAQGKAKILTAFNLPPAIDISTYDPITAALAGQANGRVVENVHAQVENTVALVAALFRSPSDAPASSELARLVTSEMAKLIGQSTGTVDLSNAAKITELIHAVEVATGITLNASVVDGASTVVTACNQQFAAIPAGVGMAYLEAVAQIKTVAQSTVADDLASAAAGDKTIASVVSANTGSALADAIAATVIAPSILVPIDIVAPATASNGAVVDFEIQAYDLAGQPLAVNSNFLSGARFPIGVTTVTVQTTDSLGNSAVATFTVTVADTTAPTLTLPENIVIEADASGGANVTLPFATAIDSVDPNPTIITSVGSGLFGLGVTSVTVIATDSAGNTTTGIFTVTVLDTTAPAISALADLTVEANATGGAFVDLPQVVVNDAADPIPLISIDTASGYFPIGTTVVNVEVIDASGNVSTASYSVTVVDTVGPSLVVPADLVIEANAIGGATITLPDALATDANDGNPTITTDVTGDFFALGTTTIHITATDAAGNVTTGSYTVTVVDTTGPLIVLPGNLEIEADTVGGAMVALPAINVTDNSDSNPTVTLDQTSGFLPLGTTVVNVVAIDASGNRTAASYTITVVSTSAPTFVSAPSLLRNGLSGQSWGASFSSFDDPLSGYNMTVEATGRGGAFVTLPTISATSTADDSPQVRFDHSSGFFPVGVTVVTVTASDSSGNQTTGTFTVTVVDNVAPELTVPVDVVIEANVAGGGANLTLPSVFVNDVVDPNPTLTFSHPSGFFPMGTTVVQVTALDAAGNSVAKSFTVTVVDTTPPEVTPPANIVVTATSVSGAQVAFLQATASDFVDGSPTVTYDHPAGAFPIGTTLVTLSATDDSGNTTLTTFTVTVAQVPTTVTLQSDSPLTSTYGDLLQFTIIVSANNGAAIPDGAIVTLVDANQQNAVVGTGTVLNGAALISVAKLNAGAHSLIATYLGDGSLAGSQSSPLNRNVTPRALSIRAVGSSKGFDGTTTSPSMPIVVGLQDGDSIVGLSQAYTSSSIGFDKTLVPAGTVSDGNAGNNYVVTRVNNVTGVITISVDPIDNSTSNVRPNFTGTGSIEGGASESITIKIYAGPVASGVPVATLQTTLANGAYDVDTLSSLTPDGVYTAQAVQAADGRTLVSNSMTFTVDTTPPVISLPAAQTMRAVKSAGVTDNKAFFATATDLITNAPTITYKVGGNVISTDFVFPIGATTVTVTATDAAGNVSTGTFQVTVINATASVTTVNAGTNAVLTALPPNAGDTIQWQFSSDGIHFTDIAGANSSSYQFPANLSQNGNYYRALFQNLTSTTSSTPTELSVVERPVVLDAVFALLENSGNGTIAGTVNGSVVNDTLTYTIIDGNASGAFSINSVTGQLSVANSSLLDFETHAAWPLTVQVTDTHGQFDVATVTVNLLDVNEVPEVEDAAFALLFTSPNNTVVGTVPGSDPDAGDTLTYSIVSGNESGAFAINPQTGVISVADSSLLDFEVHPVWNLIVRATDGDGLAATGSVTISLTGQNITPELKLNGESVLFRAKTAKVSGPVAIAPNVTVTDPDSSPAFRLGGGTLTFRIEYEAKVSKKGKIKAFDSIGGLGGVSSIGTSTGPQVSNGNLGMTINLHANTTVAQVQSFLRGLTFTTKGAGLKSAVRFMKAQVTDANGAASNVLEQAIVVIR